MTTRTSKSVRNPTRHSPSRTNGEVFEWIGGRLRFERMLADLREQTAGRDPNRTSDDPLTA